jgi:hypothetical protein
MMGVPFVVTTVVMMSARPFFRIVTTMVTLFAPAAQQFFQQSGEACLFLLRQAGKHLLYKLSLTGIYPRRFCVAGFCQGNINIAFIHLIFTAENKAICLYL